MKTDQNSNLTLIIVMALSMILGLLVGILLSIDVNMNETHKEDNKNTSTSNIDSKYYKELVYSSYERLDECPSCGYKFNYKYYPLNNEYMQDKLLELGENSDISIDNNTKSSQP